MGIEARVEIISDSSAAKGIASRIGIGKIKHLDAGWLWIQECVKHGKIVLRKISGKHNPADLMTKPKSAAEAVRLTEQVGYKLIIREGGKNETLTCFVKRIMKGSFDDLQDQERTRDWWYDKMTVRKGWEDE